MSERAEKGDWLNTVSFRFIQIQLCVIYMFSGLKKLKEHSWWDGTAIAETLSAYDFNLINSSSILLLSGFLAAFTVLFEVYFPVLIWAPKLRKALLMIGLCFHVSLGFLLNNYFFSLIMLSAYILFIPSESLRKFFLKWIKN